MKSTELRIGNLVAHKHLKGGVLYDYDSITFIVENAISINSAKHVGRTIDSVKPIPLTEEWLIKFGFEYKEMYYQSEYLVALNDCFMIIERVNGLFYVDAPNNELKHVHQLQNIYFSLTGEELTIKE